ncbi:cell division protein FtsQ/DivIB [Corynebacterium sp. sy039]|uniref:cell division protein FtsQ/DivIB n=1 Tax=Corynebacterium sp. sy039 TaxID=2599641 RepID=UPI0011B82137|nr:FtsQ-type POTRA domain-containing protein [Corynebacterium sp. sy039]QDZ42916.1 FtsQ-type POTRA domain-containing protein [Corynebacterium sp. sy039]
MSRKKIVVSLIGILLALGIAGALLWFRPILTVKNFVVDGAVHESKELISQTSGINLGDNLVRVNAHAAASKISELPWVDSASVRISFPNSVAISVVERRVVLFSEHEDGAHLIDQHGRPFSIEQPPIGVPKITGITDDIKILREAIAIVEGLDEPVRARIVEINAKSAVELTLISDDGKRIYWGSSDNRDAKLAAVAAALSRAEQNVDISGAPMIAVRP